MKISGLGPSLLALLAAACQPAAAPATALPPTQPAPAATRTPAPPSATPTALPPTGTPTRTTTPLPTIPTADFTPGDVYGVWARSDPDRGDLFLVFFEDGAYRASHGSPDGVVHSGRYTLEGRLFTYLNGWNCSPLPDDTPGQYVLRMGGAGQWLFFDLYVDTCPDRPASLKSVRWTRYVPTPTPTP